MKSYCREACVETIQEALNAEENGADRIEYCSHLELDGLTPNFTEVSDLLNEIHIPVRVMIRPRGGDFVYSQQDKTNMIASIHAFKVLDIEGFVFGGLTPGGIPDYPLLKEIVKAASPLPVTFHKAIDNCSDIPRAVYELSRIDGVDTILSSGGEATAWEGRAMLKKMIRIGSPNLTIMPAGKITLANVNPLHEILQTRWYHGRNIT